jgi:hypothetical protein
VKFKNSMTAILIWDFIGL